MGSSRISVPAEPVFVVPDPQGRRVPASGMLSGVYLAVSMLLLLRMAFGFWGLRRLLREAKPIPSLGSGVFESDQFVVPGSVQARIVLPRAWIDWDAGKLRAVLAHESAHIRRRDWVIRAASHFNVCIFWFHPLAWWMERELARLAEEACDDAALSEIPDREEYAAALVDVAHAAAAEGGVLNWRVIGMVKESNVSRRVNRILSPVLPVPKPFGRLAWVMLLAGSLPMIYLSAAVQLAPVKLMAQEAPPRTPLAMCILIDNSGSMRDKRAEVRAAALALVKATQPRDEVCIVDFNDEAFIDVPPGKDFTSNVKEMEEALTRIDSRGGTALRDAIQMSIDHVARRAHHQRKVLVLVTGGNDNASAVSQEQLLDKVKSSGLPVYCIGLLRDNSSDAGAARVALGQLAEASGGLAYYPKDLREVESASSKIANELRK
jgi:Mg-chelatase subunit ChlD